jgi:hypothetical protein
VVGVGMTLIVCSFRAGLGLPQTRLFRLLY